MRTAAPNETSIVEDASPLALPAAPPDGTRNLIITTATGTATVYASGADTITSGATTLQLTITVPPGTPQEMVYASRVWYVVTPTLNSVAGPPPVGQVLTGSSSPPGFAWAPASGGGSSSFVVGMYIETAITYTVLTAPVNWLIPNNLAVSRVRWAALWVALGSPNTGDGAHTFNLPNRQDRFPVGAGNTYTIGQTGGAVSTSVTITASTLPVTSPWSVSASDSGHSHGITPNAPNVFSPGGGAQFIIGATNTAIQNVAFPTTTNTGTANITASMGSNGAGGNALSISTLSPYYGVGYLIYSGPAQGSAAVSTVTGLSESTGLVGDAITITGTNFDIADQVHFGTFAVSSFTIVSSTSITTTVPVGVTGTVDVTVHSDYGTSATSSADQFTALVTPLQYVQDKSVVASSGSTIPVTGLTATTAGNSVIIGMTSSDQTVLSIADNGSVHFTWAKVVSGATGSLDAEVWLGTGGTGATTVTVTLVGTTASSRANASEWTGALIADGAPVNTHATSATLTSPTTTQSMTSGLFYAVGRGATSNIASGPTGTGWTALLPAVGTNATTFAYLNSTDSASHNTTWGLTSQAWESAGASFHV